MSPELRRIITSPARRSPDELRALVAGYKAENEELRNDPTLVDPWNDEECYTDYTLWDLIKTIFSREKH